MIEDRKNRPLRDKKDFLIFGNPHIEEPEVKEVVDSLRSGWLGTGPKVQQFEEDFRVYKQAPFAVAVNSCTAALHLSMLAAGIGPGDEVITTAMTFCATVNAIIHSGATPVLADCDLSTCCIDPACIRDKITSRTKAILPVHFAGAACDMEAIMSIAEEYNLRVIEDCAHAIETTYKGRPLGTFGDFGCFSFYATKNVVTGEGGMVLTKRKEDADKIKVLALHGMSKDAWRRFSDDGYKHYQVVQLGFKYNMMDLQAAIGIHQLNRVERNWRRRQMVWQRYQQELKGLPIGLPAEPSPDVKHGYHLFTIMVDEKRTRISRDDFLSAMNTENIGTGVHYQSIPTHPYYHKIYGWNPEDYPNSYLIGQQTVSLPLSSKLSDKDVGDVILAVKKILGKVVKLTTPISTLFAVDSTNQEIVTKVHCLECREESLESKESRQYIFHFDKNIVNLWNENEKDFIRSVILSKKELRLIAFHISASCSEPVLKEGIFYCGGREFSPEEMLGNVDNNISWLKSCLNDRNIKIAVENNNYYPTPAYRYITDSDFISRVVVENQLEFVFDLAHAKITAHNKGQSYQSYIKGLPLDRMVQLHISKHAINEQGLAYDAHRLPDQSVVREVKEIIDKFSPEYLTIEYYENKDKLLRILDEFRQLCIESKREKYEQKFFE